MKRALDSLDRGEAAAIALALELGVSQVLMDEANGRAVCQGDGPASDR